MGSKHAHAHTRTNTHTTLFICPPLHLSSISSILVLSSLNNTMSVMHNQAPGLGIVIRVHTTPFSTVKLLACLDNRESCRLPRSVNTCSPHMEKDTQPAASWPDRWDLFQPVGLCRGDLTIYQRIMHSGVTGQDNSLRN